MNYPEGNDAVVYGEDIFAGYRYFDRLKIEPLFPFGFGLSYARFDYSNIRLSAGAIDLAKDSSVTIQVRVDVTNSGGVAGKEIVQFYVSQVSTPGLVRPEQELKGWYKLFIEPGRTVTAEMTLDWVSVAYWDDKPHKWVVDADADFEIIARKHGMDPGISARFKTAAKFVRV